MESGIPVILVRWALPSCTIVCGRNSMFQAPKPLTVLRAILGRLASTRHQDSAPEFSIPGSWRYRLLYVICACVLYNTQCLFLAARPYRISGVRHSFNCQASAAALVCGPGLRLCRAHRRVGWTWGCCVALRPGPVPPPQLWGSRPAPHC